MTIGRRFARNSVALASASLVTLVLGAIYRIFIARAFDEVDFGKYVFITVYMAYFSDFALLGFRGVVVREVAKDAARYASFLSEALKLRGVATLAAYGLSCLILLFMHKGGDVQLAVIIYGVSLFAVAAIDILEGMIVARESSAYVTISATISNLLKIAIGIQLLYLGYGLLTIVSLFVVISFLHLAISSYYFRKTFAGVEPSFQEKGTVTRRYLLKESMPFFYISLVGRVYYKNDILLLSLFKGERVVGWYGAAYLAIDALLAVVWSTVNAAYPVMAKAYDNDREYLNRFQSSLSRYLMLLFAFVALVLTAIGPELILYLFGNKYAAAVPVLRILAWMPAAEAVNSVMNTVLVSGYNQGVVARLSLWNAAINLALCLALIPKYSFMGAAVGTVVSAYLAMAIAMGAVSRKVQRVDGWMVAGKPLLCALLACGLNYLCKPAIGPWMAMLASLSAYAAAVVVTKAVGMEDYRTIRAIFTRKAATAECL